MHAYVQELEYILAQSIQSDYICGVYVHTLDKHYSCAGCENSQGHIATEKGCGRYCYRTVDKTPCQHSY